MLRVICLSQSRRSPSQQPEGRASRGAEGHSSQSTPAPGSALSSGLSPHSPLEPLPCCLTEGGDWKWDPVYELMACHFPIPREVPNAWSGAADSAHPRCPDPGWGDGTRGAARHCVLTPMGTLLVPREFPAPLTLWEQFSPMLCYFLSPVHLIYHFTKLF